MPYQAYEYSAFISYHRQDTIQPDQDWASWIQQLLERFPTAPELAGKWSRYDDPIPASMPRVFRDRSEIGAGGDLPALIKDALKKSRVLVVLCTPGSASSEWVAKEISEFKKLGRVDPIVAVLLSGEPNASDPRRECYPEPLRFSLQEDGSLDRIIKEEPAWVDFRGIHGEIGFLSSEAYKTHLQAENKYSSSYIDKCLLEYAVKIEDSRIRLLAGVLGLPYRDVDDVDKLRHTEAIKRAQSEAVAERRAKKLRLIFILVMSGVISILLYMLLATRNDLAHHQSRIVELLAKTEQNVVANQSQLSAPVMPSGQVEVASSTAILERNKWGAMWTTAHKNGSPSLESMYQNAIAESRRQLDQTPNDKEWLYNLAYSYGGLGWYLSTLPKHEEAIEVSKAGLEHIRKLMALEPSNALAKWQASMTLWQLGSSQEEIGALVESEKSLIESAKLIDEVCNDTTPDPWHYADQGAVLNRLALFYLHRATAIELSAKTNSLSNFEKACDVYEQAKLSFSKIPASHPRYQEVMLNLNYTHQNLYIVLAKLGRIDRSNVINRENLEVVRWLAKQMPEDQARQIDVSRVLGHLASSLLGNNKVEKSTVNQLVAEATKNLEEIRSKPNFTDNKDFHDTKSYIESLK